MRELELKCVVDADFDLRPARLSIPGAFLASRKTKWIHDAYFDTDDLRLARWGVTLRWRDGDGWTVKIPRPSSDTAVLDRDEIHVDGERSAIPTESVALVAPFARGRALVEVAHIDTQRTARRWRRHDGTTLGELVDDHVSGSLLTDLASMGENRSNERTFREIEFEIDPSAKARSMRTVVEHLGPEAERSAVPKLVRVLGDAAAAPADVVIPTMPQHPSAAEVIHGAIAASVIRLLTHVPAARLGIDPEGVHQARVATRRLRSDLDTFAPLLDRKWAKGLRRELRWLADDLGAVRDADVLDGYLAAALRANPEIVPADGAEIRTCLSRQRNASRDSLLEHLADDRATALFDRLVEAANAPALRKRAHRHQASAVLPPLVLASWHALRDAVDELGESPTDPALHEIRILAKRARYGAEAVRPASGRKAARFAKAAASIQDRLGDLHDSAVAADWLQEEAAATSTSGAFAAGRLAQQLRTEAAAQRTDWSSSYERLQRRTGWLEDDSS